MSSWKIKYPSWSPASRDYQRKAVKLVLLFFELVAFVSANATCDRTNNKIIPYCSMVFFENPNDAHASRIWISLKHFFLLHGTKWDLNPRLLSNCTTFNAFFTFKYFIHNWFKMHMQSNESLVMIYTYMLCIVRRKMVDYFFNLER